MNDKELLIKLSKKRDSMRRALTRTKGGIEYSRKLDEITGFERAMRLTKKLLKNNNVL